MGAKDAAAAGGGDGDKQEPEAAAEAAVDAGEEPKAVFQRAADDPCYIPSHHNENMYANFSHDDYQEVSASTLSSDDEVYNENSPPIGVQDLERRTRANGQAEDGRRPDKKVIIFDNVHRSDSSSYCFSGN